MNTHSHQSLGRYCIEREIGRGAMGVVYRAKDPTIDRVVAIKTISLEGQDPAAELDYRERFLLEARAAGRLSHPGIVTIFDAAEDPASREPFIVMEYVGGEPLNRLLSHEGGRLPAETALLFALEVAEGLEYAHSHGVVHGDIKPANVLITRDRHAKIADFGVARFNHCQVTTTGKIFGSPAYMAPEQLSGGAADARSDLFSLGVMLYSMLTGFRPFQGNSAETVCFKVMNVEPVPVTSFQAELPPGLDRIVSRAIAKDPRDRYQSGFEMAEDIRGFMQRRSSDDLLAQTTRLAVSARGTTNLGQRMSTAFIWHAVGVVFLTTVALSAWQLNKVLAAAAITPPSPQTPSAPVIYKTVMAPNVLTPLRKVVHSLKSAPATEMSKLQVEILHHFNTGKASVWIDDQLVLDQDLHGDEQRHSVFRAVEMNQTANLEFAQGRHTVEIRVVSPASAYDQKDVLEAELAAGKQRVLIVNCDKRKMQVALR